MTLNLLFIVLFSFLIAEEINTRKVSEISKSTELEWEGSITEPPEFCRIFFIHGIPSAPSYSTNMRAVFVARITDLPTINGYSGNVPRHWKLYKQEHGNTEFVVEWLLRNRIFDGVCSYDLVTHSWKEFSAVRDGMSYRIGDLIDFTANGESEKFKVSGWWASERNGTWTIGKEAKILVFLSPGTRQPLELTAALHTFSPEQRPVLNAGIVVNGFPVGKWTTGPADGWGFHRTVTIPADVVAANRHLEITFQIDAPLSPASLGLSKDNRKLGFAFHWIRLDFLPESEQ